MKKLKNQKIEKFFFFFSLIFLMFSCKKEIKKEIIENKDKEINPPFSIKYAKGFDIKYFENYKIVQVFYRLKNYTYVLGKDKSLIPQYLQKFTFIKIPIKRIICLSTTHISLLDFMNETHSLIGISGAKFVSNKKVRNSISQNKIKEIGYDANLNYELILKMKSDFVMAYDVNSSNNFNKLENLGIKLVMNGEYLENHPLGKMEWIKFLSAFYDKEKFVIDKFNKVVKNYENLKKLIKDIKIKPKIMTNILWKDLWYVPGGKSYMAKLIEDAGGDYIWKDNNNKNSTPLNFETVLLKARNSDIWINIGSAKRLEEVIAIDERLRYFKAFSNDKMFNNNKRSFSNGGNDYWESGMTKPDIILKDLIKIFHPEKLKNYELYFYQKI